MTCEYTVEMLPYLTKRVVILARVLLQHSQNNFKKLFRIRRDV